MCYCCWFALPERNGSDVSGKVGLRQLQVFPIGLHLHPDPNYLSRIPKRLL